jgi:cytochrome oxidase Cu insertion factor (SCO1/SenC/PrrC family)
VTKPYNFPHFRSRHLLEDAARTVRASGIQPGELAPDFELPRADGGRLRLSDLREQPVLLRFGSFT